MSSPDRGSPHHLGNGSVRSFIFPFQDPQQRLKGHQRTSDTWWTVSELMHPGIAPESLSPYNNTGVSADDTWDLSDSLADLYQTVNQHRGKHAKKRHSKKEKKVDITKWLNEDTSHGFIRVFSPDTENASSRIFSCTLATPAQKLCLKCGMPPSSLHVQFNGENIARLDPWDCPLAIQNEYLTNLGYNQVRRIQEQGTNEELPFLVKFYSGKPIHDSTYSRNQLSSNLLVRKGRLLFQWVHRLCVISGTRLQIYRDPSKLSKSTVVQLAKGAVEEVRLKGHDLCLKVTSTIQGDRSIYLAFSSEGEFSKWFRKIKKATSKLPTKADVSRCHLEFLPETIFINDDLQVLNLRHNALKERPIDEDIYMIGWLDDLPKFQNLRILNLADNHLSAFPQSLCEIRTLVELNIASNKIEELPAEICQLKHLGVLHAHNNHLTALPDQMLQMKRLSVVVLAFNRFMNVPHAILHQEDSQIDSIIMAGNLIERLSGNVLARMKNIKKIDFRLNRLVLLPSEMAKFQTLEHVTHLDLRDNNIVDLDIRPMTSLEYFSCERNGLTSMQISGVSLKNLFAARNRLETIQISPKPEWLVNMDVSHNLLYDLPGWLSDCFFLVKLNLSHNQLSELPDRLFACSRKLILFRADHNKLKSFPSQLQNFAVEEMHLEHNRLEWLPTDFFFKANKLKYLNLTKNELTSLPLPNENTSMNKLQEVYLTANRLGDEAIGIISCFPRLRILHIAQNRIVNISSRDVIQMESLTELNVSSNRLKQLPAVLGGHPRIEIIKAHTNFLRELPDFRGTASLKILDVGSNRLLNISLTELTSFHVHMLDISGNQNLLKNSSSELAGIRKQKRLGMVDTRGHDRSLLDVNSSLNEQDLPWESGFSQTSGMRNKLSVAVLNKTQFRKNTEALSQFRENTEALFGIFDGGKSDEVVKILVNQVPDVLAAELSLPNSQNEYLKYTMLTANRNLRAVGQKVGAAVALCHISETKSRGQFRLHVANVGDTEVVLCRRGQAVVMTQKYSVTDNKEECNRVFKSDGIITEDGRINGVTYNTRLLGCGYLYPQVIPDPHVLDVLLLREDTMIIVANQGLWQYMSYQSAIDEIVEIMDPVIAAKTLQDLAQGYGSKENIAILVVRLLLSDKEKQKVRSVLQVQLGPQGQVESTLMSYEEVDEEVPKLTQKYNGIEEEIDSSLSQTSNSLVEGMASVYVKPLPHRHYKKRNAAAEWEALMQKRLQDEVKDKEIESMIRSSQEDVNLTMEAMAGSEENWSTLSLKERLRAISLLNNVSLSTQSIPLNKVVAAQPGEVPSVPQGPAVKMNNIDRDAILFHQMQIAHAQKSVSYSTDSIQSDPLQVPMREYHPRSKSSSHSIEVLIQVEKEEHVTPSRTHSQPDHTENPAMGKRNILGNLELDMNSNTITTIEQLKETNVESTEGDSCTKIVAISYL